MMTPPYTRQRSLPIDKIKEIVGEYVTDGAPRIGPVRAAITKVLVGGYAACGTPGPFTGVPGAWLRTLAAQANKVADELDHAELEAGLR